MRSLSIQVILRRLESKQENQRITMLIKSTTKNQKLTNKREIRNGYAKFFGESFLLPLKVQTFSFLVLDADTEKCLSTLSVSNETVTEITSKTNVFKTENSAFKLIWEAKIINENQEKNMEGTERDENDLNQTPTDGNTKITSLQPAENIRRRRKSIKKLKISDAVSDPGDDKNTKNEEIFFSNKKRVSHRITMNGLDSGLDYAIPAKQVIFPIEEDQFQSKKSTSKSKTKNRITAKESSKNGSHFKLQRLESTPEKTQYAKRQKSEKKINDKNKEVCKKLPRSKSNILEHCRAKELILTGIFGIISGIVAAQI